MTNALLRSFEPISRSATSHTVRAIPGVVGRAAVALTG